MFSLAAARPARADIPWQTKLDQAREASLAANRPMFVEFWATWCTVCAGMDEDVYSDPRVGEAMRRVLPVRIDVDAEPSLARKYAIDATPTIVLTDSYGNELFRWVGDVPRDRMLTLLGALPADITAINRLAAAAAADKNDFAALQALARELRDKAFYLASNTALERAGKTKAAKRDPALRAALLLDKGRNYLSLGVEDEARRALEKIAAEYPNTPAAAEASRLLGGIPDR